MQFAELPVHRKMWSDCDLSSDSEVDLGQDHNHPLQWITQTPDTSPRQSLHADLALVPPLALDDILSDLQGLEPSKSDACSYWAQACAPRPMPLPQEVPKNRKAPPSCFSSRSTCAEDTDASYSDSSMSSHQWSAYSHRKTKVAPAMPPGVLLPARRKSSGTPATALPLSDLVPGTSSKVAAPTPGPDKPPGVLTASSALQKSKVRVGIMIMPGEECSSEKKASDSSNGKVRTGVFMMPLDRNHTGFPETHTSSRSQASVHTRRAPASASADMQNGSTSSGIEQAPAHDQCALTSAMSCAWRGASSSSTEEVSLQTKIPQSVPMSDPRPFGIRHRFHDETRSYGALNEDCREFTKTQFQGLLSVITEDQVHTKGLHKYMVRFNTGELSSADGVGFVFSPKLPCSKNIQRIVSIFVNRAGRICMRAHNEVKRSDVGVRPLELGDWIVVAIDLDECTASFTVWPHDGSQPSSATFAFGSILADLKRREPKKTPIIGGHLACVVKNEGVSVTLAS